MADEEHPESDEAASFLLDRAAEVGVDQDIDWSEVEAQDEHPFREWRSE